jgi:ribokinase
MAKVVIIGSFNTDLITYLPHLPARGESVTGSQFLTGAGGKGSNQAIGAARLGAEVTLVACVGDDNFGQAGIQMWAEAGINTRYIVRDSQHHTGVATIFVEDGTGENMIAFAPGANQSLLPAHVDAAAEAIASADILLTQLEVPLATVHRALELARQYGVPTVLNPAPAAALPDTLLKLVDYLTPNETEAERLMGKSDTPANMARQLAQCTGQTVVVTIGAQGAVYAEQNNLHGHIPAFPVDAIDTVGAGDAFNAGLTVALADGQSLAQALRFACAVGALAVTRHGAAASMPQRAEVEALLAQSTG